MTESGLKIMVTAFTHQGVTRTSNEDTIAIDTWIRNEPMKEPRQSEHDQETPLICLVADGMGGHVGGEVASRRVAEGLKAQNVKNEESLNRDLKQINRELFNTMDDSPRLRGMGSTIVGICVLTNEIIWFNVGDSRLFRIRDGFVRQLSIDDVPNPYDDVNQRSHGITQALGGATHYTKIEPHTGKEPLVAGWQYLICSDGLTDMLDMETIESLLGQSDRLMVESLFNRAMEAGGNDNISIILVTCGLTMPRRISAPA